MNILHSTKHKSIRGRWPGEIPTCRRPPYLYYHHLSLSFVSQRLVLQHYTTRVFCRRYSAVVQLPLTVFFFEFTNLLWMTCSSALFAHWLVYYIYSNIFIAGTSEYVSLTCLYSLLWPLNEKSSIVHRH